MKKYSNGESPMPNILAGGTNIIGEIETEGDIRIDGRVSGKIRAKGKVVIGSEGYVEGEVNCKIIDISGEVKANLITEELTVLMASAKFIGEITTPKISIEPGAIFIGNCKMDFDGKLQLDEKKKKEKKQSA